jgi:phenylalanyl-tRNA synthetase beta chain
MKISLDWLGDYVEINHSAEEVAEILSNVGLPCEGIERIGDDTVIDLEVTSNRGDCLGHIGVARELAAATGKELKMPDIALDESPKNAAESVSVEIAEPELCGRYTARLIESVKVGPSPDRVVKRLEAVGLRSVNNVVDATNYATMETGQPPHAFDFEKIAQGKIIVRKAKAGEHITSIDGSKHELKPDMLIIADAEGPVALAGVMGGLDTEVSESTTTILLEDAHFSPVSVRSTSRRLGLPSEAAFRFERNVDIEMIDWASQRTAQLITQLAGGKVAVGVVDAYPGKAKPKTVALRPSRLNKLLGIEVPHDEVIRILSALSFRPEGKDGQVICTVPSWRSDIYREADLIEEVARVYGYDKIPLEKKINIEVATIDSRTDLANKTGLFLNACGFYETINVSFVDESTAELFAGPGQAKYLKVTDESRKSANLLRQNLTGSLLGVLKSNYNAKNIPCRVFELADTYIPQGQTSEELPKEKTILALVCDSDFRELRGVVEGLLKTVNKKICPVFKPAELPWAGAGAEIIVQEETIGSIGMVSQAVVDKFGLKEVVPCAAELDFTVLMEMYGQIEKVKPIPRFPAIVRDLSIIIDEKFRWSEVITAIDKKAPSELESVEFVGIYRGKPIPSGRKSVTLSLRFRDEDGTLRHEVVDGWEKEIVASLADAVGAELRTV